MYFDTIGWNEIFDASNVSIQSRIEAKKKNDQNVGKIMKKAFDPIAQ